MSRIHAVLALGLAGLALGAATVPAQQGSKPTPGCAGLATEDPVGDVTGGGGENYDVKALFFTFDGSRLNAHVQVANLSLEIAKPGLNLRWILIYRAGDTYYYVRALTDGSEMTYRYGTYDPALDDFTGVADVKGSYVAGPDGVITMEIPKGAGAKAGGKISDSWVSVRETVEVTSPAPATAYAPQNDRAPDSGGGKEYVVATCSNATGGAPAITPPVVTPPTAMTPPPAQLGVKAPTSGGSAARANKRRRVALRLTSSAPVSALRVELLKGSRVVGVGSLARLDRSATVRIKLKRRLSKGSYGLRLSGTIADGRKADSVARLRFAR